MRIADRPAARRRAAPRRIDGDHRDLALWKGTHEALQQLVGQRSSCQPAGARDAITGAARFRARGPGDQLTGPPSPSPTRATVMVAAMCA